MTFSFTVGERFREAAAEWGEARMMDEEQALESKAEQALLEIEHLVSGGTEVAFSVDGDTVVLEPSEELETFLEAQSEAAGLEPERLLRLHVDLFARVFLDDDMQRPPNAPPK